MWIFSRQSNPFRAAERGWKSCTFMRMSWHWEVLALPVQSAPWEWADTENSFTCLVRSVLLFARIPLQYVHVCKPVCARYKEDENGSLVPQLLFAAVVVQSLRHVCPLRPCGLQPARLPCPSLSPRVCSNPCPPSWWYHPTISSSVTSFSFCLQSFPASGSFPMSQLFASGGQSIGVSASTSVLPMNTQDWSPLGWTGWISLHSRDSNESSPTPQFKSIKASVLWPTLHFQHFSQNLEVKATPVVNNTPLPTLKKYHGYELNLNWT